MLRHIKIMLFVSVALTVLLYWVDIYLLDPVAPVDGWRYRIINFLECFIIYVPLFFSVFAAVYFAIVGVRKLLGIKRTT